VSASPAAALLAAGGGVVPSGLGAQLLTWVLLDAVALGLLHVALAATRKRLPIAWFCLLGALAGTAVGAWILWPTVAAGARRSPAVGFVWGPGFAVGLFCVSAVVAAAWAGTTRGLATFLEGRRSSGPPRA
jgi:hypothetical protein